MRNSCTYPFLLMILFLLVVSSIVKSDDTPTSQPATKPAERRKSLSGVPGFINAIPAKFRPRGSADWTPELAGQASEWANANLREGVLTIEGELQGTIENFDHNTELSLKGDDTVGGHGYLFRMSCAMRDRDKDAAAKVPRPRLVKVSGVISRIAISAPRSGDATVDLTLNECALLGNRKSPKKVSKQF